MVKTIIIYLGGLGPEHPPLDQVETVANIAVDSGLQLAHQHKVKVDLVVGDMDSVDLELLSKYEQQGSIVSRFPIEKDETDFELALMAAQNYFADRLMVIGGGGGRIDHLLTNIAIACGSPTEKWIVEMYADHERIRVCRPGQSCTFDATLGGTISLIPIGSLAKGVTTSGLKWNLVNSTLRTDKGLGVSNVATGNIVEVSVEQGSIAVIEALS